MNIKEKAKHILAMIEADERGETVEYEYEPGKRIVAVGFKADGMTIFDHPERYRIKPKRVTRPWSKPEDVPAPICWVRQTPTDRAKLITEVSDDGVMFGYGGTGASWLWFTNYPAQYSTDRKTWHPCTVTEESK